MNKSEREPTFRDMDIALIWSPTANREEID